jgi:hypothetical protein
MSGIVLVLTDLDSIPDNRTVNIAKTNAESLPLKLNCLRALANFTTTAHGSHLFHLWQYLITPTGAFAELSPSQNRSNLAWQELGEMNFFIRFCIFLSAVRPKNQIGRD